MTLGWIGLLSGCYVGLYCYYFNLDSVFYCVITLILIVWKCVVGWVGFGVWISGVFRVMFSVVLLIRGRNYGDRG